MHVEVIRCFSACHVPSPVDGRWADSRSRRRGQLFGLRQHHHPNNNPYTTLSISTVLHTPPYTTPSNLHDILSNDTSAANPQIHPAWQPQMPRAPSRQCSLLWRPCNPTQTAHRKERHTHSWSSSKSPPRRGRRASRSCRHLPRTIRPSCSLPPH